jgi:hypothetical protein
VAGHPAGRIAVTPEAAWHAFARRGGIPLGAREVPAAGRACDGASGRRPGPGAPGASQPTREELVWERSARGMENVRGPAGRATRRGIAHQGERPGSDEKESGEKDAGVIPRGRGRRRGGDGCIRRGRAMRAGARGRGRARGVREGSRPGGGSRLGAQRYQGAAAVGTGPRRREQDPDAEGPQAADREGYPPAAARPAHAWQRPEQAPE